MDIRTASHPSSLMLPSSIVFNRVALELEVWAHIGGVPVAVHEYCDDGLPDGVVVGSDAGVGHLEMATRPHKTILDAVYELEWVISRLPPEWELVFRVKRPSDIGGHGEWVEKERYKALRRAAKRVAPDRWQGINGMTDMACVQLNVSSSRIAATDPSMMLLMNVMNNVGSYIAAQLHKELGYGIGHLGAWNFAEEWMLPSWAHWFPSWDDFSDWFSGKQRFILEDPPESDTWVDLPDGQTCSVNASADLGTFWPCMRPKLNPDGERYWEFRPLPSMEPCEVARYGLQLMSVFELIVGWHQAHFHDEPLGREAAADVFAHVHAYHPHLFPPAMIGEGEWRRLLSQ